MFTDIKKLFIFDTYKTTKTKQNESTRFKSRNKNKLRERNYY